MDLFKKNDVYRSLINLITILTILLIILLGCTPAEPPPITPPPMEESPEETEPPTIEEPSTETEELLEEEIESPPEETTEDQAPSGEETIIEETVLTKEQQIQEIFDKSQKIRSYYYRYKAPSGKQYDIFVKDNKIKINHISDDYEIYIDTTTQTAEEWCTIYTKCGREWGKITDLDYYDAYIETPMDWLPKISESKKIDEGVYYGKQSLKLETNIGEVIVDSNFGFIYSIENEDRSYTFTDAKFNIITDSDVNVPEHLLSE